MPSPPPATSTLPSGIRTDANDWWKYASICPVAVQVPLAGSYNSVLPKECTTSTLPSRSSTAEPPSGLTIGPVALQVPLFGSYTSAP